MPIDEFDGPPEDDDNFDPFAGAEKREPDETDRSLEPILVNMCKVIGFDIRDSAGVIPTVVSVDVGYKVSSDESGMERHVRIVFNMPEDFEEKYIHFAKERIVKDALRIIRGDEEESDSADQGG